MFNYKFDIKKQLNFADDLINIFTDYAFTLDTFFKDENNRIKHKELYDEYLFLNDNIKKAVKKRGFM